MSAALAAAATAPEDTLAKLPPHHFQNLYNPAYELVHVLHAISRCKAELITPSAYRAGAVNVDRDGRKTA